MRNLFPGHPQAAPAETAEVHAEVREAGLGRFATMVAGVDEVGRGSLFGPVVAAAGDPGPDLPHSGTTRFQVVDAETRERLAPRIRQHSLAWAVAAVDVPPSIDSIFTGPPSWLWSKRLP